MRLKRRMRATTMVHYDSVTVQSTSALRVCHADESHTSFPSLSGVFGTSMPSVAARLLAPLVSSHNLISPAASANGVSRPGPVAWPLQLRTHREPCSFLASMAFLALGICYTLVTRRRRCRRQCWAGATQCLAARVTQSPTAPPNYTIYLWPMLYFGDTIVGLRPCCPRCNYGGPRCDVSPAHRLHSS